MSQTQPNGYLALPSSGTGKPVLVLHAWWGLNDTIRAFCDRLAEAGFVVFAPDLYAGAVTDQISEAEKLVGEMSSKEAQTNTEILNAIEYLRQQAGSAGGVTVIGFSMGAYYALSLSNSAPEHFQSVVLFYGTGPADFSQSQAAYLGHFAENDEFEPLENVRELENDLKQAGRPVTFYTYPGTGHWFFEPDRTDVYNAEASSLAWDRTLDFLKRSS